jgi:pantetheine-phosphate adenylyltransferase
MTGRVAIYPGSFDPLTDGHLSIIRRAARLFDRLIVVVGYNPNKKTLFPVEERTRLIREETRDLPNVEVDSFTGELLVSYARRVGGTIVVRGLRNEADFRNEFQQSKMNHQMMPELETIFLLSDEEEIFVSSTLVRDLIKEGGDYTLFVPDAVEALQTSEGHP